MDDICPAYVLLYNPEPAMQQWTALWGYAAGLATLAPVAAVWRLWPWR
jgi:hypothetical protein